MLLYIIVIQNCLDLRLNIQNSLMQITTAMGTWCLSQGRSTLAMLLHDLLHERTSVSIPHSCFCLFMQCSSPRNGWCSHSSHISFQLFYQPTEMTNYLSETWEWYQFSCKDGAPVISICMEVSAADQGTFFLLETLNQRLKLICSANWKHTWDWKDCKQYSTW